MRDIWWRHVQGIDDGGETRDDDNRKLEYSPDRLDGTAKDEGGIDYKSREIKNERDQK